MGWFTYRNARKAAVSSRRTEKLLYEEARRADGSGYQDAGEIGEDLGKLLAAALTLMVLPILWLKFKLGSVLGLVLAVAVFGLMLMAPVLLLGYAVWCVVLAVTWLE